MPKTSQTRIRAAATQPVVLQALIDGGSQTTEQLRAHLQMDAMQIYNALRALVAAGRARRNGDIYTATEAPLNRALRQANSVWQYARRVEALA